MVTEAGIADESHGRIGSVTTESGNYSVSLAEDTGGAGVNNLSITRLDASGHPDPTYGIGEETVITPHPMAFLHDLMIFTLPCTLIRMVL